MSRCSTHQYDARGGFVVHALPPTTLSKHTALMPLWMNPTLDEQEGTNHMIWQVKDRSDHVSAPGWGKEISSLVVIVSIQRIVPSIAFHHERKLRRSGRARRGICERRHWQHVEQQHRLEAHTTKANGIAPTKEGTNEHQTQETPPPLAPNTSPSKLQENSSQQRCSRLTGRQSQGSSKTYPKSPRATGSDAPLRLIQRARHNIARPVLH